jgi:hypothetical protein
MHRLGIFKPLILSIYVFFFLLLTWKLPLVSA